MQGELQGEVFTSEITAVLVLAVPIFAICLCEIAFCLLTIISVLLPLFSLDAEYEAMSVTRCTISSISPERAAPALWAVHSPCVLNAAPPYPLTACQRSWQSQTLPLGLQKAFRAHVNGEHNQHCSQPSLLQRYVIP